MSEVAIGLLDKRQIQKLPRVAQERELILRTTVPFKLTRVTEEEPRLANKIECDIRKPKVLLERRGMTHPFGKPLPENEARVGEPQHIAQARLFAQHVDA